MRNGGFNFALFWRHATAVELLVYDEPETPQHCALIALLDLFNFTRVIVDLRRRHVVLRRERFSTDAELTWFVADGSLPV